jgi:hypothetical protein
MKIRKIPILFLSGSFPPIGMHFIEHQPDSSPVDFVFLLQNTGRQAFLGIPLQHFHGALHQNWPRIDPFVGNVHRASGHFRSMLQCLPLCMKTRE